MTGFGQAETENNKFNCKVEFKALNGKFLELNLRLPRNWQHKESGLRNETIKMLERGSVNINVNLTYKRAEDKVMPINHDVADYYISEIRKISAKNGLNENSLLNNIFDLPNIIQPKEEDNNEEDWKIILQTIHSAFADFEGFRKREGEVIANELSGLCKSIYSKLAELEPFEETRVRNIRQKIAKELEVIHTDLVDKNRFEQELVYYIEKLDISEERSRLSQHCEFFQQTLKQGSTGKKLGFIAQEMGREINTIGSKSNEANMQRKVVEMKDELEKIKEQINNVL